MNNSTDPIVNIVPSYTMKCPKCDLETCGVFGDPSNKWLHCSSCFNSGTKGWMISNNIYGMLTQLNIRKYLKKCKEEYFDNAISCDEKMSYGIPSADYDPVKKEFFDNILFLSKPALFRKLASSMQRRCRKTGRIAWKETYPFVAIEQYPGLVSGVCFLTKQGPISIFLSEVSKRVENVVRLYCPENFSKIILVSNINKGLAIAKEHAILKTNTCVLSTPPCELQIRGRTS